MAKLKAFLGVARAPFLALPVTLVAAGAAAAYFEGELELFNSILALVGLVALHMAVNIFNEVSDMRTGIDLATVRTPFSGGSGTLPAKEMSSRAALIFGICCAAVGCAIGVWFVLTIGMTLVPLLAIGVVCVVAYTDLLARIGLGEIAAGLGLGGLPVVGTAVVQQGSWHASAIAAAVPAFFMTFNLLLLNEFPDEHADQQGGRRNLVLLLGRPAAAKVWLTAALAVPAALVVAVASGVLPLVCLVAAAPTALLFKGMRWALATPQAAVPQPALAANVIWNLATNTLVAVALVVAG